MKLMIVGELVVLIFAPARSMEITRRNVELDALGQSDETGFYDEPVAEESSVERAISTRDACWDDLGTFTNAAPYNNAKVPHCRTMVGTEFYLYGASSGTTIIKPTDIPANKASFPTTKDIKIIIHGLTSSCKTSWVNDMVTEYRKKNAYTLVCVNWEKGANWLLDYEQAAGNTRVVAAEIVQFLNTIGISLSRVHLIGHSLGAHTAGHVGQAFRTLRIGRITGLDPAEPNFQFMDPRVRLDSSDANFVDVIHTDTSSFALTYGYGLEQAVGHIDFYPNGGISQPGCSGFGCHHGRACTYFAESINSACRFTGYTCPNSAQWYAGGCTSCDATGCPTMGEAVEKTKRGVYFLSTRGSSPHCAASEYRVDVTVGSDYNSNAGALTMTLTGTSGSDVSYLNYYHQKFVASQRHPFMVGLKNVGTIQKVKLEWTGSFGKNIRVDQIEVFDVKNNRRSKSCSSLLINSNMSGEMALSC